MIKITITITNWTIFVRVMGFSIWWDKSNAATRITPWTTVAPRGPHGRLLVHAVVLLMGLPRRVTLPVLNCHPNHYSNHSIEYRTGCSYYHCYHHHRFLCLSFTEKEDLWFVAMKFSALAMRWRTASVCRVSRLHNRPHMIPALFRYCTCEILSIE